MRSGDIKTPSTESTFGHARDPRVAIRRLEISGLCLFFLILFPTAMPAALASDEAKKLLALTDYIGGDYKNAIRAGKIIDQDEYQEMLEFSSRSLEILNQLKAREGRDSAGIEKDLQALASHIKRKSDEKLVSELAQQIKDRLIVAYKIITYPKALPTLEAGRTVYTQNCAQCHGATGRGDGTQRTEACKLHGHEPHERSLTL
jgi:high-affinity iron transporter